MQNLQHIHVPRQKRKREQKFSFVLDKTCDEQTMPIALVGSSQVSFRTYNNKQKLWLLPSFCLGTWTGYLSTIFLTLPRKWATRDHAILLPTNSLFMCQDKDENEGKNQGLVCSGNTV